MAKDHGSSVKDDKQYEGLRRKGMSKARAARIANSPDASSEGGKKSGWTLAHIQRFGSSPPRVVGFGASARSRRGGADGHSVRGDGVDR